MAYTEKRRHGLWHNFGKKGKKPKNENSSANVPIDEALENVVVPINDKELYEAWRPFESVFELEFKKPVKEEKEEKEEEKHRPKLIFASEEDYRKWVANVLSASDNVENDEKTKRKIDREVAKMKEAGVSKVLFVCSANVDRSATAENLFKNKEGLEVKSAGVSKTAFTKLTSEMVKWADKIYVMEPKFKRNVVRMVPEAESKTESLNIGDYYYRNQPVLKKLILNEIDKTF